MGTKTPESCRKSAKKKHDGLLSINEAKDIYEPPLEECMHDPLNEIDQDFIGMLGHTHHLRGNLWDAINNYSNIYYRTDKSTSVSRQLSFVTIEHTIDQLVIETAKRCFANFPPQEDFDGNKNA